MAKVGSGSRSQGGRDCKNPLAIVGTTGDVLALIREAEELLTPVERRRAREFRQDEDRRDFIAAHALVRSCAARLLGTAMESVTVVQS
jgi:4'-phosphopantetheinyl transferase